MNVSSSFECNCHIICVNLPILYDNKQKENETFMNLEKISVDMFNIRKFSFKELKDLKMINMINFNSIIQTFYNIFIWNN